MRLTAQQWCDKAVDLGLYVVMNKDDQYIVFATPDGDIINVVQSDYVKRLVKNFKIGDACSLDAYKMIINY